mmetsp:Transcript_40237/g.61407  ORF Transcript_40237/g.61407 Transcript_40237/m.61407 type:complete len:216 (-) Transcript_40237:1632-2279(-)
MACWNLQRHVGLQLAEHHALNVGYFFLLVLLELEHLFIELDVEGAQQALVVLRLLLELLLKFIVLRLETSHLRRQLVDNLVLMRHALAHVVEHLEDLRDYYLVHLAEVLFELGILPSQSIAFRLQVFHLLLGRSQGITKSDCLFRRRGISVASSRPENVLLFIEDSLRVRALGAEAVVVASEETLLEIKHVAARALHPVLLTLLLEVAVEILAEH